MHRRGDLRHLRLRLRLLHVGLGLRLGLDRRLGHRGRLRLCLLLDRGFRLGVVLSLGPFHLSLRPPERLRDRRLPLLGVLLLDSRRLARPKAFRSHSPSGSNLRSW